MNRLTTTKINGTVPHDYTLCINDKCPKVAICLRRIAVSMMPAEVQKWSIVSPAYLAQIEGECPMYRLAQKVRYARGFVRMLSALTVAQAHAVKENIISAFGMAMYYRMRKGTRPITPDEQEMICGMLAEAGVADRPEFDAYVEDYLW